MPSSLRRRIIAAFFVMTLFICLLFASGLFFAFESAEENLFEEHLKDDITTFLHQYSVMPGIASIARDNYEVLVSENGDTSLFPAYLQDLPPGTDEIRRGDQILELVTIEQNGALFYFLIEETSMERFEQMLVSSVMIIIVAICLVSVLLGYLLSNRVIKPVTRLSEEVNRLETATLPLSSTVFKGKDEISILRHAIDAFRTRVNVLLSRERDFSSDVSHELRTPLMGIQAAAENLRLNSGDVSRVLELSRRIEARCRQMRLLIDSMLVLARDPHSLENDFHEVNMRDIVDDQLEAASHHLAGRHIDTRVIEHERLFVFSSEAIASVVFSNLFRNALFHSESTDIRIELYARSLVIRDFGHGMPDAARDRVTGGPAGERPGAAKGNGIGLLLVRRLCDHFGWSLTVQSEPAQGTAITVWF